MFDGIRFLAMLLITLGNLLFKIGDLMQQCWSAVVE